MLSARSIIYGTLALLVALAAAFVVWPLLAPHRVGDPAVIARAAAASAAIPRVPGEDFHGVYIGADEARILAALGAGVQRLPSQENWAQAYSTLWMKSVDVDGVPMEAHFHMDLDTDLLRAILLRSEKTWTGRDFYARDYGTLDAALTSRFGAPASTGVRNGLGQAWTVGRTAITLEYTQTPMADGNWEMLTLRYHHPGQI